MPTFTFPPIGQPGQAAELRESGLRMEVIIGPHEQDVRTRRQPLAPNLPGIAELDTGGDGTLIDGPALGASLALFPVTGDAIMHGAALLAEDRSRLDRKRPTIALSIRFPNLGWTVSISRVIVTDGLGRGALVVVGRDVLSLCSLTYDGRAGRFSVSIP